MRSQLSTYQIKNYLSQICTFHRPLFSWQRVSCSGSSSSFDHKLKETWGICRISVVYHVRPVIRLIYIMNNISVRFVRDLLFLPMILRMGNILVQRRTNRRSLNDQKSLGFYLTYIVKICKTMANRQVNVNIINIKDSL